MRLTLRTLLAYLDKVLDPNDTKDLQEKVAQGRLARGMVDRIQSVVKRPKLAAPKVDARGSAGDANIVAEYLDNTLPVQHVADFEQMCLAEDARLAEIASCHQILTIVLAKPAVVSAPLRDRIRRLGDMGDAKPEPTEGNPKRGSDVLESLRDSVVERNGKRFRIDSAHRNSDSTTDEVRPSPQRPIATAGLELDDQLINHVPEYLKSGKSGEWTNALSIIGLLAALCVVLWLSFGSLDDIRSLLHKNTDIVQNPSVPVTESNTTDDAHVISTEAEPPVPAIASGIPVDPPKIFEVSSAPPGAPLEPSGEVEATVQDQNEKNEAAMKMPSAEQPTSDPIASPLIEPSDVRNIQWQPETKESKAGIVFAKRDSSNEVPSIRRLANGDTLSPNEQLIVPPAFRTEFLIAPGIRWVVADETVLMPLSTEESDSAAVELRLGRALVHATPDCKNILMHTPVHPIVIQMKDPSCIVAVELRHMRMIGKTVEQAIESLATGPIGMMRPVLSIVCVAGEASVSTPNEEPIPLEVGQGTEWSMETPARAIVIKDIPWWYRNDVQRPIDAEAAQDLVVRLSNETDNADKDAKSAIDLLHASLGGRRNETAALAIRALSLLGEYSKAFGSDGTLSSSASRPHRSVILESFYQSLGANPSYLTSLKETIEKTDLPRAPRLLGLLGLPDDPQLADGADRSLVESLSSPFIDERVLGIYQLTAILGKDHGFQSDRPTVDSVQQWKRLLNSAKIRWPK